VLPPLTGPGSRVIWGQRAGGRGRMRRCECVQSKHALQQESGTHTDRQASGIGNNGSGKSLQHTGRRLPRPHEGHPRTPPYPPPRGWRWPCWWPIPAHVISRTLPPPARMVSASLYTSGVATPKCPKPCASGVATGGALGCSRGHGDGGLSPRSRTQVAQTTQVQRHVCGVSHRATDAHGASRQPVISTPSHQGQAAAMVC
jgi:hypothetical protein